MITYLKTLEEAQKYKYGKNSYRECDYNPTRCAYEVLAVSGAYQCKRKNGHGINKLYCKQHEKRN